MGVSGHQARTGLDWDWTAERVREQLAQHSPVAGAYTSLAVGTDQLFAREALAVNVSVTVVIPMENYERTFGEEDLVFYRELLARCSIVQLESPGTDEEAFFAAGRLVVDSSDLLVAVWDGKPAAGLGGTADVVSYCRQTGRTVVHIDPFAHEVHILLSTT